MLTTPYTVTEIHREPVVVATKWRMTSGWFRTDPRRYRRMLRRFKAGKGGPRPEKRWWGYQIHRGR